MSYIERPHEVRVIKDFLRLHRPDTDDGSIDISEYVVHINKLTDVGTGEIASGHFMLNATDGQFITLHTKDDLPVVTPTNPETTPKIDQYTEFYINLTDDYGDGTRHFERIMYLDDELPQRTLEGQLFPLELYGREAYLKKIKITGWFWFITFADMVYTILKYYNAKKGQHQPFVYFKVGNTETTVPPAGMVPRTWSERSTFTRGSTAMTRSCRWWPA